MTAHRAVATAFSQATRLPLHLLISCIISSLRCIKSNRYSEEVVYVHCRSIRVLTRGLLKDGLQIVHFDQCITRNVVHTAYDCGVISRWQRSNDRRLTWLSRSMPTVLDRANLVGGDDPGDYGSLPIVIRGNQRPCTVVQFQCRISQYIGNPKRSELRTNGTQNHSLCLAALDNEPANHHVVTGLNKFAGADVA